MANHLSVLAGELANEYLAAAEDLPASLGRASRLPTLTQLRAALDSLGWTYDVGEWRGGWWFSRTDRNDGDDPELDFQELELNDDSYGFRLGPARGPFEIIRAVARTCGPQVAVEHSGARGVIVTEETTYREFLDGLYR
jgi:hypothetical protein